MRASEADRAASAAADWSASWVVAVRPPKMIRPTKSAKAGTPIALILKDLGLIGDLAGQLGARLEIGKCAEGIFEAARQAGYGDDDMAGLVRPYEQVAGVEIKRARPS